MIKEELIQTAIFYCLNPFCSDKNNRKFNNDDRHLLREQCKKWIIEEDRLNTVYEPLQAKIINNLQIDFQNHPLQAFEILSRLRQSDWRKVLDGEEAKTKKEIIRAVEVEFEAVREKLSQLLENADFFSRVCRLAEVNPDPSSLLNDFYDENLFALNALRSKVLFKRIQLKEAVSQIKQQVQKIFESIIEEQTGKGEGKISHSEQRKFHEFVFEQTSEYYNKLQVLAPALRKSVPTYRVEEEKMVLDCCLCQRSIRAPVQPANKKAVKKYLAEQILTHIYCSHYGEAAFAYSHRIAKSFLTALTFQQFLEESRRSSRITIVDRESGVIFEEQFSAESAGNLTVEVVSVKNVGMARGRYILVQNHLSTDCLIAILSYACTERDQNVQIVSNRAALKTGIEELLWCSTKQEQPVKKE